MQWGKSLRSPPPQPRGQCWRALAGGEDFQV